MKYAIVLGTRPEIIKLSPIIRELTRRKTDYFIVHSNQHYSPKMDEVFFDELKLPKAKYNLGVGERSHAKMTAKIFENLEDILINEKPDLVLVQGDTNTAMAGALAASKLGIAIAHLEAGLRSYDKKMPEEINRIIIDHISDYLFAPTEQSATVLKSEGIPDHKIHVVGNTIVDAVGQNLIISEGKADTLKKYEIKDQGYFLLTLHRPSNVDSKEVLSRILGAMYKISEIYNLPIIFPIHPRTKKQIDKFELKLPPGICGIEPVGFLEMLQLESQAKIIFTDSGGLQEESCILKVPCVVLRQNTERPEVIKAGAGILAGSDPGMIVESARVMLKKPKTWENPLGDGKSAVKILNIIEKSNKTI